MCICLDDFVVMVQCWIVVLILGLEEAFDFAPRGPWIAF